MTQNDITERVTQALKEDWPPYAIGLLTEVLQLRADLQAHLKAHNAWAAPARQILVSVVMALAVTLAFWLAAGRLPAIFG